MAVDLKRTRKYKAIRESLMEQLRLRKADAECYVSAIDHYMEMWVISRQLEEDIRENGIAYYEEAKNGVEVRKNNQSIKDLAIISRQMLSVLKELKLRTEDIVEDDEDDEDW